MRKPVEDLPGTASVQAETGEQEQTKQEQGEFPGSSEEEGVEIIGGGNGRKIL